MKLRHTALLIAAAFTPMQAALAADNYPSRPVTLVVPFAAGGGTDVVARLVAHGLTEIWGQSVVVENRPGANTITGTEFVAKSKPDGYTLLMASPSHTINPSLYKSTLRFNTLKDFSPSVPGRSV